jgi:hypothetical protein
MATASARATLKVVQRCCSSIADRSSGANSTIVSPPAQLPDEMDEDVDAAKA